MKIKLIKIQGCKTCKEVLIFLNRDEDGVDSVNIIAWHHHEDMDLIQYEVISSDESFTLERIIADFSEASANEFANNMKF